MIPRAARNWSGRGAQRAMSFPYHDRFWTETADFVAERLAPGESVLAPDIFWWRFERIARYRNTLRVLAQ